MGHMGGPDGLMCGGMMGHGMMGHGMMGPGMYRIMFALMDTDGDGTISLEEFQAAHAKIFKAMDANKDGKLTPEEMKMFWTGGSPASHQQLPQTGSLTLNLLRLWRGRPRSCSCVAPIQVGERLAISGQHFIAA